MFQQGNGLLPPGGPPRQTGIIAGQQLHQGGGDLLGGPARTLGLERMPVALADGQAAVQLFSEGKRALRPEGSGGWRPTCGRSVSGRGIADGHGEAAWSGDGRVRRALHWT